MDTDGEPLDSDGAPRRRPVLSEREVEVVSLVARGFANKAIAATLEISGFTVSSHLRRVFAKLGVSTRAQMVAAAKDAGLLHAAPRDVSPGADAREHFDWSVRRAMEYLHQDEPILAMSSLASDLGKHEGTREILGRELQALMMREYLARGAEGVRRFITGLSAPARDVT